MSSCFQVYCCTTVCVFFVTACSSGPSTVGTYPGRPVSLKARPVHSSQFDVGPKLLSGNFPDYPISRIRDSEPGYAVIEFTVDEHGVPGSFRAISWSYPYFASHAMLAVQKWRFQPGLKKGRPVPVKMRITFYYDILGQPRVGPPNGSS
jgi:TonB family protein